jgi:hypothetical protein
MVLAFKNMAEEVPRITLGQVLMKAGIAAEGDGGEAIDSKIVKLGRTFVTKRRFQTPESTTPQSQTVSIPRSNDFTIPA